MLPVEIEKIKEETERVEKELFPPQPPTGATGATGPAQKAGATGPKGPAELPGFEGATGATGDGPGEKEEHKYSVLKGKYDKEVPRLHKDLKSANEHLLAIQSENAKLRESLASMNSRIATIEGSGAQPAEQAQMLKDLENDPDVQVAMQNFPDVWKAVDKAITKRVEAIKVTTVGKLEKVEADLKRADETAKMTADQAFSNYLDSNVEGWREVNVDDNFKAWLRQPVDKYSGRTKMDIIMEDISRKNAPKVAEFFVDFAKEKQAEAESAKSSQAPVEATDGKPAEPEKVPVKVAPPKGRVSAPPRNVEPDKTIITSDHIADFYDKVRRGFYNGKPEIMLTEEKRIEKAVAEGRIA